MNDLIPVIQLRLERRFFSQRRVEILLQIAAHFFRQICSQERIQYLVGQAGWGGWKIFFQVEFSLPVAGFRLPVTGNR